jgi:hypothetical protein
MVEEEEEEVYIIGIERVECRGCVYVCVKVHTHTHTHTHTHYTLLHSSTLFHHHYYYYYLPN